MIRGKNNLNQQSIKKGKNERMKTIEVILLEEKAELEKIINDAQKRLKKAPQGHIRITEKNGKPHFYYKGEKMGKGGKSQIKIRENYCG